MSFTNFWSDSRGKVILILLITWIFALVHHLQLTEVAFPLGAVSTVCFVDWVITKIRYGRNVLSLSSIVTGLLIGLILDPNGSLWLIVVAALVAVLNKQFLRSDIHHHMFNPAAFGIVLSAQVFSGNIAWWSVSWGVWPVIVIGLGMLWILSGIRRAFLPLTFLLVFFGINVVRMGFGESLRFVFDGAPFLFAFIMLPEPMTSLARGFWQYVWGTLVGVFFYVCILLPLNIIDPFLTALLGANLIGFFVRLGEA